MRVPHRYPGNLAGGIFYSLNLSSINSSFPTPGKEKAKEGDTEGESFRKKQEGETVSPTYNSKVPEGDESIELEL